MTYKINILQNVNNDLNYLRRNDKNSYVKVTSSKRRGMPTRAKSDKIISNRDNNVK